MHGNNVINIFYAGFNYDPFGSDIDFVRNSKFLRLK